MDIKDNSVTVGDFFLEFKQQADAGFLLLFKGQPLVATFPSVDGVVQNETYHALYKKIQQSFKEKDKLHLLIVAFLSDFGLLDFYANSVKMTSGKAAVVYAALNLSNKLKTNTMLT